MGILQVGSTGVPKSRLRQHELPRVKIEVGGRLQLLVERWFRERREAGHGCPPREVYFSETACSVLRDVLLEADAQAADRNEKRLRNKTWWVGLTALTLAVAIVLLVAGVVGP